MEALAVRGSSMSLKWSTWECSCGFEEVEEELKVFRGFIPIIKYI
jgi:hypothetical protein